MAALDFTRLFHFTRGCGQLRKAIGHTRLRHHCVSSLEPEAPSNGSWILAEGLVAVAIVVNEELWLSSSAISMM